MTSIIQPVVRYALAVKEVVERGTELKKELLGPKNDKLDTIGNNKYTLLFSHGAWTEDSEKRHLYIAFDPINGFPVDSFHGITQLFEKEDRTRHCMYLTNDKAKIENGRYIGRLALKADTCKHILVEYNDGKQEPPNTSMFVMYTNIGGNHRLYLPLTICKDERALSYMFSGITAPEIPPEIYDVAFSTSAWKGNTAQNIMTNLPTKNITIKRGTVLYHVGAYVGTVFVDHTDMSDRVINQQPTESEEEFEKNVKKAQTFFRHHPVFQPSVLTTVPPCKVKSEDGMALAEYIVPKDFDMKNDKVMSLVCLEGNQRNKDFMAGIHEMIDRMCQNLKVFDLQDLVLLIWNKLPPVVDGNVDYHTIDSSSYVNIVTFHQSGEAKMADIHKRMFVDGDSEKGVPSIVTVSNLTQVVELNPAKLTVK